MNAAAAKAVADHWLGSHFGNLPYAGDPVMVGMIWRVPIHADFPVPNDPVPLSFRDLGKILIDTRSGEVITAPTSKEREARMAEEIGRVLGNIHNAIPPFKCERCGGCCGPIGATAMEINIIDEHVRRNHIEVPEYIQINLSSSMIARSTNDILCPYLKDRECLVYPVRPTICRLFGTTASRMPCVAGCGVEKPLTTKAAFAILRRVDVLSTLWGVMCKHGWRGSN